MAKEQFKTMTEQMYYILLCLSNECCGMDILDKVPAMTGGRVKVGSGTLYHLLEQFAEASLIIKVSVKDRKPSYVLTDKGRTALKQEYQRLKAQLNDYDRLLGERDK